MYFRSFFPGLLISLWAVVMTAGCALTAGVEQYRIEQPFNQEEEDQNFIVAYALSNSLKLKRTESGLFYKIEGGDMEYRPGVGSLVTVAYTSTLPEVDVLVSSSTPEAPFTFRMDDPLIPGWKEAVGMMGLGSKGVFLIPTHLGYGEEGNGEIPPNSVLRLDLEILEIRFSENP